MADVLENKRTATRFRILVEIADRQPAVSQGEIADAVGVTSQAVSEYIRELVDEGFVEKEGRSRYRVTKEGVDWLLQEATDVRRFAEHVTDDILATVQEDAAIATDAVEEGERVSLSLVDGLLHATPGDEGPATGVATTDAESGQDVGVTGFEGVIDLDPGSVTVLGIPPVRDGGSRSADTDRLADVCADVSITVAACIEAVVALRSVGIDPVTYFAPGDVAADAAGRGLDVAVVTTTDSVGRVTDVLRDADVSYEVSTVD
jgi:putative transcriptional regulator